MDKCGEARTQGRKIAFDTSGYSVVEPNSYSLSERSGRSQSFLNVNAATRDAEREKSRGTRAYAISVG
jgi:hypothetical protein